MIHFTPNPQQKATPEEKLEKIIKFAIKNGWDFGYYDSDDENVDFLLNDHERPSISELLFDHPFAKAVFGEEGTDLSNCPYCDYIGFYDVPIWQYHLQQAVISENPIDYYFEYINETSRATEMVGET